ncbi:bifunctional UDP-N-acetylmuramoyl-tripeptide:D-alanyl-D-alanine ligase/alanine racemase [Catalinimonas niigatensis]|uniref:bifunctional UDP-N-acetylmuramoyl-tripeptide:D-alanyl-D-alanine ligase/alanine racemase n=1 Tax=Catalinimonas niigatensis TaxID=1397264 RepID=UPI0026664F08|nr:bifunctional UDP-N-acetylmuramoyl-tripeptide:D-alanyl-D-alanine ligase/alanine racemase [Catalinimonas niigatensis]WPP51533.1 bifunctional UDP-N-acetylmuramoyl-tripeptide:D-alanyl-D-alanine ligase/alanine racemase [Catalinimonas niigatensis]
MTFEELAAHSLGKIIRIAVAQRKIYHLLTDSRQAIIRPESVFFAIRGAHHNGHQFIESLYHAGCRQFVVEELPFIDMPDTNICLVDDCIQALQATVVAHRTLFSLPVVGITGSNGKTIVKEWLSQLLAAKYRVIKSPKSYNSQIGVPLSVWPLNPEHEIGVFEAGISLPGEMTKLQKVIQPEVGIFTNLGPAHDQGFIDQHQKAIEKAKLFINSKIIIYRKDFQEIDQVLQTQHSEDELLSWTGHQMSQANLWVNFSVSNEGGTQILIRKASNGKGYTFVVSFQDDASLENVVHCIVFLLYQGWAQEDIQKGLDQLRQVKMRMELKEGINQCYLLDDSYSNDLAGLKIALDYLQRQGQNDKRTVILSDLLENGYSDEMLYQEVVKLLQAHAVHKVILLGPRSYLYRQFFENQSWEFHHYAQTETYLNMLKSEDYKQENILVKGARAFGFESIVKRLQQKITSTTLEINLDAIIHNLNYIRSLLNPGTKMMVMVKAFSYGGAAFEIASLLQYHRVDYLAVAYVDEGVMLRQHGINTPILVLNPSVDSFPLMIAHHLEPEIYSLQLLKLWIETVKNTDVPPPIHLKLDTGMHRLGFVYNEIGELATFLKMYPDLEVSSIFSHLVASEDAHEDRFTFQQIGQYKQMYNSLTQSLGYFPIRHILNSGGIQRFSQYQFDMVRLGIGLYGIDVTGQEQSHLRPISTLRTVISQIKELQVGETVGYNRRGKVEQPKKIATIAIGYADGLDRRLGNGSLHVWVNGYPAPTIGNICMDMSMIDISGILAAEGDEVIIFGDLQPVSVLAEAMKTIPYEVLTGISARVKRIFFSDT